MNLLRPVKFYFDDLLEGDGKVREKAWKRDLVMEKIEEISENTSISISTTKLNEMTYQPQYNIIHSSNSAYRDFYYSFLTKLSQKPKIFRYFCMEAESSDLLCRRRIRTSKTPNRILASSLKLTVQDSISNLSDSSEAEEKDINKSKSGRNGVLSYAPFNFHKFKKTLPQTPSSHSSSFGLPTPVNKFRNMRKPQILKPDDPVLHEIFKKICNEKHRFSIEDFKRYLNLRYPAAICESMCKHFKFKQTTYEDYVTEMNKFVQQGEERHLNFCFDIYDFNKDKLITYYDAFKLMEVRNSSYFDEDIVLITEMFEMKSEGKLKGQGTNILFRRRSTFTMIKDKSENKSTAATEKRIKRIENISLTFKDFCKIKFVGRPTILQDFFFYTCNYDFMVSRGFIANIPKHSAKSSEGIVVDMNISSEFNEKLMKSEKYEYYCALDSAMGIYPKKQLEDLLKKFKFLQSETHLKLKVISKQSMIQKLVTPT